MAEPNEWNPFQAPEARSAEAPKPVPTPAQIGRFWGTLFGSYYLGRLAVLILQAIILQHTSEWFLYLTLGTALLFCLVVLAGWLGPRFGLLKKLVEVPCYALVAAICIAAAMWISGSLEVLIVRRIPLTAPLLGIALKSMLPSIYQLFFFIFGHLLLMCLVIWWRLRVHRRKASA